MCCLTSDRLQCVHTDKLCKELFKPDGHRLLYFRNVDNLLVPSELVLHQQVSVEQEQLPATSVWYRSGP